MEQTESTEFPIGRNVGILAAEVKVMDHNTIRQFTGLCVALCLSFMAMATALPAWSHDTELYSATYQAGATGRPKVLIIFDDSGSMDEIVYGEKPDYDPTPNVPYVVTVPADRVYWSTDGSAPSLTGWNNESDQWFSADKNRCGSSYDTLDSNGLFSNATAARWRLTNGQWETTTTRGACLRWFWWWCVEYEQITVDYWDGDAAGWVALEPGDNSPEHVECAQDVLGNPTNPDNGDYFGDGYPQAAAAPDTAVADAYTASANNTVSWPATYTFYTSDYMNWYYDNSIVTEDKDYLQIAQETIETIVTTNTGIDFGLEVFNYNYDPNNYNGHSGGRIVKRIIPNMTAQDRTDLVSVLWGFDHSGNTPLCESTYEAYRYITGKTVKYGDDRNSSYDNPDRDRDAEDPVGTYASPLEDCTNTYIILMTDGLPTRDGDANDEIQALPGVNSCWVDPDDHHNTSCLPTITQYMASEDLDGQFANGVQNVLTATIGFNVSRSADNLLRATATLTNDQNQPAYYYAESAEDLTESFQNILLGIMETETTFTAPAVSVNSFTRTQSLDDVFFAMFEPQIRSDWRGNIKKLKFVLTEVNGEAVAELQDADDQPAINADGEIKDSARTYWSTGNDGATITQGGVGERLLKRTLSTRKIYGATGANGALQLLNANNVTADVFGLTPGDPAFYQIWQVANQAELEETLDWAWGYDVDDNDDDGDTSDTRGWIMPDVLHSKPLIVNYGALGNFTEQNPDLRILAGTNGGFLHMFSNSTGDEDWAYFPLDLAPVLTQRRKNTTNGENVYGVDSPAVVYKIDHNGDGTIDAANDGDKAYVYFGLRRGGKSLHALDISDPDNPEFLWAGNDGLAGFSEMGQSWSVPQVTTIPGYSDNAGYPKPVVIFGAGFDTNKDDQGLATPDDEGRGVFILDAVTGAVVWSVTPADTSATNMKEAGLLHSVAAPVSLLDSNGDQRTDRIYFADTGGNVWRIDLPGNTLPTTQQNTWHIVKMLTVNGGTTSTDRRFFSAVDVVRAVYAGSTVDVLLIGSGDRTNPADLDNPDDVNDPSVDNQFYMIRDEKTVPYVDAVDPVKCSSEPDYDFRCRLPLGTDNLYDVTADLIRLGTDEQIEDAYDALNDPSNSGWRLDLGSNGEKSLSASVTISGKVYFTTFSPDIDEALECGFTTGQARLYIVDLFNATAVRDFNDDTTKERFWTIGSLIPDTIATHTGSDREMRGLVPPSKGSDVLGNPFNLDDMFPTPSSVFWHREEYQ